MAPPPTKPAPANGGVNLDEAGTLLLDLLRDTGVVGAAPPRRYLWTDAFAVRTLWGLHASGRRPETGEDRSFGDLARETIRQVHRVLGSYRPDDPRRSGPLSGLPADEAETHPTAGGLRIGKPLPERRPGDPADAELEWKRDGQYFHYLTRWMRALLVSADVAGESHFVRWSIELARAAHAGCVRIRDDGSPDHIAWKMSVDLSRPLVDRPGLHDALDGYLTFRAVADAAQRHGIDASGLEDPIRDMADLCGLPDRRDWTTDDPLGLGGLMLDLHLATHPGRTGSDAGVTRADDARLVSDIADAIRRGLRGLDASGALRRPAEYRLPFRDLGLSLGVRALHRLRETAREDGGDLSRAHVAELAEAAPEPDAIERVWRSAEGQAASTWTDHVDINRAMLAASLAPDGVLLA